MSVTLRNANYIYTARTHNPISGGGVHTELRYGPIVNVVMYKVDAARSSNSLRVSTSERKRLIITVPRPLINRGRTAIPQVSQKRTDIKGALL